MNGIIKTTLKNSYNISFRAVNIVTCPFCNFSSRFVCKNVTFFYIATPIFFLYNNPMLFSFFLPIQNYNRSRNACYNQRKLAVDPSTRHVMTRVAAVQYILIAFQELVFRSVTELYRRRFGIKIRYKTNFLPAVVVFCSTSLSLYNTRYFPTTVNFIRCRQST